MLKKRILDVLNTHINREFYSAYLYLSMSAYTESIGLKGFANWFMIQYKEEVSHAMKFFNYVHERGGRVNLTAIDQPQHEWKDIIEIFEKTLEHEQYITSCIDELTNVAMEEKDHATVNMLQWFISEQVEEEANVTDILDQLKLVEGRGNGLFMLDRELKGRTFVDATQE